MTQRIHAPIRALSLVIDEIKWRQSAFAFVKFEGPAARWRGPLRTLWPGTGRTAQSDGIRMLDAQIFAARIMQRRSNICRNAQTDGKGRRISARTGTDTLHRTRQGEPYRTIFQSHQLRADFCRLFEHAVNIPKRTAMGAFYQRGITGAGIAFGDHAGAIDSNHEKRQAPRSDSLQSRQPMGNLFKTGTETALE